MSIQPMSSLPGPVRKPAAQPSEVRVVTYNTAVGNAKIKTPQASFTRIPFYREALTNAPGAPILCLQEVGSAQLAAARQAEAAGGCRVFAQMVGPGQYNMLVVPARYQVESQRAERFALPQLKAIPRELWNWVTRGETPRWVDMWQPRGFQQVGLQDGVTGRHLTVFNTHLALDKAVRLEQVEQLFRQANAASASGGVIVAGDLNTRSPGTDPEGRHAKVRQAFGDFRDMGPEDGSTHRSDIGNIDWVLARGFDAVSGQVHRGKLLDRDAAQVSDHFAEDDRLSFGT